MRVPAMFRSVLIALIALLAVGVQHARADSGSIVLTVYKAGWIIGGSGGHGTLTFRGRTYSFSVGGIDYGLVFGGSKTVLRGRGEEYQPRLRRGRRIWRGGRGGWPSAAAHAPSCSPIKRALCWSLRAGRSG